MGSWYIELSMQTLIFVFVNLGLLLVSGQDYPCVEDGYFPDLLNCKKYWQCWHGEPSHLTCANDWLFDAAHGYCDHPDRVCCGDIDACDVNDQNCHPWCPATPTPAPECNMECTNDGFFPNPDEPCSQDFCECISGVPYVFHCPDGLIYNPAVEACDFCFKSTDAAANKFLDN